MADGDITEIDMWEKDAFITLNGEEHFFQFKEEPTIQEAHRFFCEQRDWVLVDHVLNVPITTNSTDKYKHCNHHHELTDKHTVIIIDGEEIVVNNEAILLIQELNRLGLTTHTHHITKEDDNAFMSILLDNVDIEIRNVDERDSTRTKYNGKKELLISWRK